MRFTMKKLKRTRRSTCGFWIQLFRQLINNFPDASTFHLIDLRIESTLMIRVYL